MNDDLNQLLKTNKTFCMFPWTHMFIDPDGDVYPCCIGNLHGSFGSVKKNTLEEIWNSDKFKELRKNMLYGKKSNCCSECYRLEGEGGDNAYSLRNYANKLTEKYFPVTNNTLPDGELKEFKLRYLDTRFSNICNFKCRYCGDIYSSAWASENRKIEPNNSLPVINHASDGNGSLMEQIKLHLDGIECIYFAGGEPLLMSEHYEILQFLIENNLTHVTLKYNSNCSKLKFKDLNVMDLWKQFKYIELGASLDSFGTRAEYMRHGTEWTEIIENLTSIKENCPNVHIGFNCVVNCLNVLTLTDFLENLIEKNLIHKKTINSFYPLTIPDIYRIQILPRNLRIEAKNKLLMFLEKYRNNKNIGEYLIGTIQNLYDNFIDIDIEEDFDLAKKFKKETILRDSLRNESFVDTFPELKDWYNSIEID